MIDGAPPPQRLGRHVVLFLATVATMCLIQGWAFCVAMMAILVAHEGGHYLSCRRHGIDASLPYFIPAPNPFGTFGAFIRIRSRFPHADALFDVGASGPWAGFVVAIVVMLTGLHLSVITSEPPPAFAYELGESLATRAMTWLVLGPLPDDVSVVYHPVALAGWGGFLVTSLNLLPVGQLDGGHVVYASGLRSRIFSLVLVAALLWLAWYRWPGWAVWAAILMLMITLGHPATMNDALPLSRGRALSAALSMLLLVVTFVPEPIRVVS